MWCPRRERTFPGPTAQKLKDATPNGVVLGSGKLATELDRLDLIDEYKLLVHPRIAGHGSTRLARSSNGASDSMPSDDGVTRPKRPGRKMRDTALASGSSDGTTGVDRNG